MTLAINEIHEGDCLELMKRIPDKSVDMILTDPPYKVISGGVVHDGSAPTGILSKNDGKIFAYNEIKIDEWIEDAYRVLKDGGHCYIFTNTLNLEHSLTTAREAGFKLHNLLVWVKNNCTPNRWYMKNVEYVLFLRKGKAKTINNASTKTAHEFANTKVRSHPTEKPTELLTSYILNSSKEGETVLDMFSGSGSTAIAALNTNRQFIGIEMDAGYVEIARNRINETRGALV